MSDESGQATQLLEQFTDLGVHEIHSLEWANHHSKLNDRAVLIHANYVDPIHVLSLDLGLELQHCRVA